ncbi:MAG: hypothetical protein Q7T70_08690 [Polaromonas sp.]|nr:hypothetical protein [Polaromonas sp.]
MSTRPDAPTTAANPASQPGSSEGMPRKQASEGRSRPGQAETPADASDEASLAMPHERDQSTDMTDPQPDAKVKQAHTDLKRGLQDTSKQPAMDDAYRKQK